jgi:hypothetical protein
MCEQVVGSYAAMPQPGAEGNTQEEEESGTECEVRSYVPGAEERTEGEKESGTEIEVRSYGWIPHNAGFGFLDLTPATLGQIHF